MLRSGQTEFGFLPHAGKFHRRNGAPLRHNTAEVLAILEGAGSELTPTQRWNASGVLGRTNGENKGGAAPKASEADSRQQKAIVLNRFDPA